MAPSDLSVFGGAMDPEISWGNHFDHQSTASRGDGLDDEDSFPADTMPRAREEMPRAREEMPRSLKRILMRR